MFMGWWRLQGALLRGSTSAYFYFAIANECNTEVMFKVGLDTDRYMRPVYR